MNVEHLIREEQIRRSREARKAMVEKHNAAIVLNEARRAVESHMRKAK